jgi:hypothetical protein
VRQTIEEAKDWADSPDSEDEDGEKKPATQLYTTLTERIRKPEHDAAEAHRKAVDDRDADLTAPGTAEGAGR